ncbi:phosphatidylethanolamine:Kdo2-lipid A phosphoethanolamine transferase [Saccharicrinis carchari]|uniref:Phosphatidylethanolamine:Kdo2-lipid A phosphoethanolamine transferase n=1 Tax=Saccharicrinis carchari TaxID=1168039 RepID=A0A521ER36_SACCC|nr:lipid A phosphoethanolamine transferase [Saccharicrinis carchari]SMO86388.1 phosphatidylethanolamine:Kdo2-lipid A phosphoethanolamine transferase [Saccharicrinis carchari]
MSDVKSILEVISHWALSAWGVLVLIVIMSLNRYLFTIVFPIFTFISAATAYFTWQLDISINTALIESIFLTDTAEISNYLSLPILGTLIASIGITVLLIIYRFSITFKKREFILILSLALMGIVIFTFTNKLRRNTLLMRAPFSYYIAYQDYKSNVKEMDSERRLLGEDAHVESDSIITLLIIGEALRADHIQTNGYFRVTMPKAEQKGALFLPHVHSPYTYTAASLRYFLTRAAPGMLDPMYTESSFIDIFKRCSFRTAWIANQNPLAALRYFINENDTIFINKPQFSDYSNTPKYDSDLIEPFTNLINQHHPRQLLMVHLAGNHWYYNKNLPEEYIQFTPILENKVLSNDNKERMINSYDNVTLFVDSVIEQFINELENKKAMVIFLADHGQSFGENGKWLHANGAPTEQNPACFFWFSDKYKIQFAEKVSQFIKNREKVVDTAFLFHTIIDGSAIKSPWIEPSWNLFSDQFQPKKANSDSQNE